MHVLDLAIFYQPPIFDYIRDIAHNLELLKGTLLDGFYRYMDNTYIYILMTDQYKYNVMYVCMVLTLTYFIAKTDKETTRKVYKLIAQIDIVNKNYLKQLESCKVFVLKKLKDLGTKDDEIDFLDKQIDFNKYLEDVFKVGEILD